MVDEQRQAKLVELVRDGYRYEVERAIEPWASLWADNARVTFPLEVPRGNSDVVSKEAIVEWTAKKFADRERTELDLEAVALADGNRVFVRLRANLFFANGVAVAGPVAAIYTFDEKDKIALVEEYVNDAAFTTELYDLVAAGTAE